VLDEMLRRGEPQLRPAFDTYDFGSWLYSLKHYRNRNYAIKTAMGLAAAGAVGAYFYLPAFQAFVDPLLAMIGLG
jgi:hypothetical protein